MTEVTAKTSNPKVIMTWWQGGERYADNIAEIGRCLKFPFVNNSIYGKVLWEQLSCDMVLCVNDWTEIFGNNNPVNLEIGIGNGEFIATKAESCPEENWVGLEVFKKVFTKAASKAARNKLGNIRLIQFDAYLILRLFPNGFLKNIYVNFPDPWPKNHHKRRRLLKTNFITLCASKLSMGGKLHITTDHYDYALEIERNISEVNDLKSTFHEAYVRNIDDYFPTKYYRKFASETGAYFFRYEKI